MRWHLLNTFDRIHVLDLHGNANKKEVTPEGKPDKNVFDIRQGVAIIIAVKTGQKKKGLAEVWHGDSWGTRHEKYDRLEHGESIRTSCSERLDVSSPLFAFRPSNIERKEEYSNFIGLTDFFPVHGLGYQTSRDDLVVAMNRDELITNIELFADKRLTDEEVRERFFGSRKKGRYEKGDTRQWLLPEARRIIQDRPDWRQKIMPSLYRPFDIRPLLYMREMVDWPRPEVLSNLLKSNLSLIMNRQTKEAFGVLCSDKLTERKIAAVYDGSTTAPLYLYPDEQDLDQTRRVNFDPKLYKRLQGLAEHPEHGTPDEVQVFDYIYGTLHCPAYRETYAEFLKIDFPRIPWPASPDEFWDISAKGSSLRKLHLMDPATIGPTPYPFDGQGDNAVDKPRYDGGPESGKIWINKTQYFADVPPVSWTFYIGGYQPAQKWLKDRKGRALSFDDVKHYQKIIKILSETDRIMQTITMDLGGGAA
jgi:predicted helicase